MGSYKTVKNISKILIAVSGFAVIISIFVFAQYSQVQADAVNINEITPSNVTEIGNIIYKIIDLLTYLIGVLAFFGIIFSGIQYITAGGEMEKAVKAKKTLTYSILGIILATMAYALTTIIASMLATGNIT